MLYTAIRGPGESYRTLLPVVTGFTSLYQGIRALLQLIDTGRELTQWLFSPINASQAVPSNWKKWNSSWKSSRQQSNKLADSLEFFTESILRWCNRLVSRLYLGLFVPHLRSDFLLLSLRILSFPFPFQDYGCYHRGTQDARAIVPFITQKIQTERNS